MLPVDVTRSLTAATQDLGRRARQLRPDLPVTDQALQALMAGLTLRLYALMLQRAPQDAQVLLNARAFDTEVTLRCAGVSRGVSVVELAHAVVFTPDGHALSDVFVEHVLNADDASMLIATSAQDPATDRLLQRAVRVLIRATVLTAQGLSVQDADALAVQEVLAEERGLFRVTEGERRPVVARSRKHRA